MKNGDNSKGLLKDQSTRSLSRYRTETIQQRVNQVSKQLLLNNKKNIITNFAFTTNQPAPLFHNNSKKQGVSHKSEEDLRRQIHVLENELKRKLNDNIILTRLFKTKNSSELSHLDIYLEMKKLQDDLNSKQFEIQRLSRECKESEQKILSLQSKISEQEEQHRKNIELIQRSIGEKTIQFRQQKIRLNEQYRRELQKQRLEVQDYKFLNEELNRKISDSNNKLKHLTEELEIERESKTLQMLSFKEDCQREIQDLRDQNQKLLVRMKEQENEYEDFKLCKEQQRQKNQSHNKKMLQSFHQQYQKLKLQHEAELREKKETIERERAHSKQKTDELIERNSQLRQQKQSLIRSYNQMVAKNKLYEQNESKFINQVSKMEQKNLKYSGEIKVLKFEKCQKQSLYEKIKLELNSKEKSIEALENKLSQSIKEYDHVFKKCEQYKKSIDSVSSLSKLNDKMHSENYKALGRLIQIKNKIRSYLPPEMEAKLKYSEQELGDVVSCLAQYLQKFIKFCYLFQKKRNDDNQQQRNIEIKEHASILEQCKHLVQNQSAEELFGKYLSILRDKNYYHSQESKDERSELGEQLVETLINLHTLKYYSSENTSNQYKDSLENTNGNKGHNSSMRKMQKFPERQDSVRNLKKRNRIVTESSQMGYPVKANLFIDQDQKENYDINFKFNFDSQNLREPKKYAKQIKQRCSTKASMKWKDKKGEGDRGNGENQKRAEIEKKYFRM